MTSDRSSISESNETLEVSSDWATSPFKFLDWCREHGSEYGVDTEKLILGATLGSIVGDDSNCFGVSLGFDYIPKISPLQQGDLIKRIELEIETPELPENVRERLREFLPLLLQSDWNREEDFLRIRDQWLRNVRDFTREEVEEHPEYEEAMYYSIYKPKELLGAYKELSSKKVKREFK